MAVTIAIMRMLSGGTMDIKNGSLTIQMVHVKRQKGAVEVTGGC